MTVEQLLKLKLDDKVTCNKSLEGFPQKGWIGKVICVPDKSYYIGIEWEKAFKYGHECNAVVVDGKKKHCRWYGTTDSENESIDIISPMCNNQLEFEF